MAETTTYAELRQRVLDGDSTVTPAALEKARRDAEFAELQDEASRRAAERAAEAERQAAMAELRRDIELLATTGLADMRAAYRGLVEAAATLQHAVADWQARARPLRTEAHRLDARDLLADLPDVKAPEHYVAEAVEDFQGRYRPLGLGREHPHVLHDDQLRDTLRRQEAERREQWYRDNPEVRFLVRHKGYEPGDVRPIEAERAAQFVAAEIAEWVE